MTTIMRLAVEVAEGGKGGLPGVGQFVGPFFGRLPRPRRANVNRLDRCVLLVETLPMLS